MSIIDATPLLAAAGGDYQISRSVRLRSSASGYLNRTFTTATAQNIWTWSGWVKRGSIDVTQTLFSGGNGTADYESRLQLSAANVFSFIDVNAAVSTTYRETTQVFRDPSAWYHIVVAYDSTQATGLDRIKIYVNGSQITAFTTTNNPTLNQNLRFNSVNSHRIGSRVIATQYFDGYLTEVNFIDGQALTSSSFGETDTITGVWKPKKYAGTYGTNGFYLNFSDNSSNTATTIGKDYSGNGNNWTPNNISVTAGVTYDSMIDVPTLYADRGNYCTLNPLIQRWAVASATFSNANQTITTSGASTSFGFGTIAVSSGKFYWEATVTAVGTATPGVGVTTNEAQSTVQTNTVVYLSNGQKEVGGSASSYGASYTTNDVIGVALDCDSGTVTFYKNNTSQGSISLVTSANLLPHFQVISNSTFNTNFGQRPFAYTTPTGFKALNTQNLPAPTILKGNQYFDVSLYTGNATARSITGVGFRPDFVWTKSRSGAESHRLYDAVRGATQSLYSNLTNAEATEAQSLTAFNSDGFSLGTGAPNSNAVTYAAWNWKANGSAVTNTSGSISSQVNAGTSQGFSVVTFTSPASGSFTVGHGLGVAPRMIITKERDGTLGWLTYHASVNSKDDYMVLNSTAAKSGVALNSWGTALPTSTVFGMTSGTSVNASKNVVAYCFSEVAGFSKFGSYTGNGSTDGPFVFCGFRPRWVLIKVSSGTADNWEIIDTSRNASNAADLPLYANLSNGEAAVTPAREDILSNGFKLRTTNGAVNRNGDTYIFAAFAESPFKNSLAR